jgi:hypothetical protein
MQVLYVKGWVGLVGGDTCNMVEWSELGRRPLEDPLTVCCDFFKELTFFKASRAGSALK